MGFERVFPSPGANGIPWCEIVMESPVGAEDPAVIPVLVAAKPALVDEKRGRALAALGGEIDPEPGVGIPVVTGQGAGRVGRHVAA